MKKIIALILALTLIMSLAACGKTDEKTDSPALPETEVPDSQPIQPEESKDPAASGSDLPDIEYPSSGSDIPEIDYPSSGSDLPSGEGDALSLLSSIWNSFPEDMKFSAGGGSGDNMSMDGPGACSLDDAEALDSLYGIPASSLGNVASAAGLMHMMNANTFTAACYQLKSGVDAESFAGELKDNILSRQWMCGFPEMLLIAELDGCVITAFGAADLMDVFKAQLQGADIIVDEPII